MVAVLVVSRSKYYEVQGATRLARSSILDTDNNGKISITTHIMGYTVQTIPNHPWRSLQTSFDELAECTTFLYIYRAL